MSKLPQLNLRIAEEYQPIVRAIAEGLRQRDADAFAADLHEWLNGRPDPASGPDLTDILARLEALEEWRANHHGGPATENPFTQPPGPPVSEWPTAPQRIDPEDLEAAAQFRKAGATWNYIAKRLDFEAGGDALRKAVDRWKRQQAKTA